MGAIGDSGEGTKELVREAVLGIVIECDQALLLRVPLRAGPDREAPLTEIRSTPAKVRPRPKGELSV